MINTGSATTTTTARLPDSEDYVDVAHIMELHSTQGGVCAHCAAWLPPRCKPADPEQATVDRLDNALAHVKGSLPALQPHAPLERESFVFFIYSLLGLYALWGLWVLKSPRARAIFFFGEM